MTPFYDVSEKESSTLQGWTDRLYQKFLSRVADGRGMSVEEVHEVAQGRVWTGASALKNGLVDELGGLDRAIEIADEKADLGNDYKLISFPVIKKDVFEQLLMDLQKTSTAKLRVPSLETQIMDKINGSLYAI